MSMTIQEAIKRINEHMSIHKIGQYPHIHLAEALHMALDALREKAEREDPKPLTLRELRGMIGEPVWVVGCGGGAWEIFAGDNDDSIWCSDETFYLTKYYGKRWHAYRHKPKEVQK